MFNGYWGWFKVDKLTQKVDSGAYVTFNITAKPSKNPLFDNTTKAPVYFQFIAYDNNSNYYYSNVYCPFTNSLFYVLVDNQSPKTINQTIGDHRSTFISIDNFTTVDIGESYNYSMNDNDTAGIAGIISYVFTLKRTFDNQVIVNTPISCKDLPSSYGFNNGVTPNTNYTITVKAIDLAGNYTSSTIPITTPPAPPKSCTVTDKTFCSFTLTWQSSSGADGYYIYDASYKKITNSLVTGTTYHVSGLAIGTSYKYYISAYSNAGGESELSPAFTFSTLTRPSMVITGSSTLCASDVATYTVSNAPASYTLFWSYYPNLIYVGGQGTNRLTVKASAGYLPPNDSLLQTSRQEQTGFSEINNESESSQSLTTTTNDYGSSSWVSVSATGECGSFPVSKTIWVGKPSFTPEIVGLTSLFPSQTSLYVEKNNGTVTWSTYGPLKTVGGGYGYKSTIKATGTGVGWVYATVSNICGSYRGELMVEVGGGTYSVYPNPATTEVTVTQTSQNTLTSRGTSSKVIKAIRIFDKSGNTFYYQKFSDEVSESKVNVSAFPAGIYYLKINEGAEEENYTIVKQ